LPAPPDDVDDVAVAADAVDGCLGGGLVWREEGGGRWMERGRWVVEVLPSVRRLHRWRVSRVGMVREGVGRVWSR
jgi:hypothetical protein